MAMLSPKTYSPTTGKPQQYQAQQAYSYSIPFSSRGFANFSSAANPLGTLMERRGRATPKLQICAFQAGAGAGTIPTSRTHVEPATSYDVLAVPPTASEGEIKTAYRRLARQYHPDRAPLAEREASTTKFLQIHSAYSLLSDPARRAQYDLQLSLTAFQSNGYKSRFPRSPRAYPASSPSSNYCSPRSPFSSGRGKSWETDQCWC